MPGKRARLLGAVFFIILLIMCGKAVAKTDGDNARAKYIFLFIGDGMGVAQRNAAELFVADKYGICRPEEARLVMNCFPAQGLTTTYDLSSVIPDSASTSTAMACGHKTRSGVIGMDAEGKRRYENIAETAKKRNWQIGILTSVSLDHATPAAFYAHVPSRTQMYEVARQLAYSGFDYFAGGQLLAPVDKKDPSRPNALDLARQNGYTVATGRSEFEALRPGKNKVMALSGLVDQDAAMYFSMDQKQGDREQIPLAEFLAKGIQLLDNPQGFFMMVEGGKIDWACHANDAAAVIHDILALDEAVAVAVRFLEKHPRETLIVVTGDHECGGMTIGFAGTKDFCHVGQIKHQKMSYQEFDKKLHEFKKHHPAAGFEEILPLIEEAFGLYVMKPEEKADLDKILRAGKAADASPEAKTAARQADLALKAGLALSDGELKMLREAFLQTWRGQKERARDEATYLRYGGYEPLTVKLTTILNNKAGIGWTTYSHTGVPVQTSALGVGADRFNGYYDQTDIYHKLMEIAGFTK